MPLEYSVYGLRVLADAPIPGLLPSDSTDGIDLRIRLNRMPSWWNRESETTDAVFYRHPFVDERGRPILTVWELKRSGWYRLVYFDDTEFFVNPLGGEIWSRWPPGATTEDSVPYLLGPVLGFVLRLRGICCLHASAVCIGQKIIALMGPPHAGKSSTAAAFAELGCPVVSDDIAVLVERDEAILVQPGYPRLSLWPDVVATLYGSPQRLPRITPETGTKDWWDKRYLDLIPAGHRFQRQSLPLSAIYLLDERMAGDDCPKVEAVAANSALVNLVANTYMNYLLDRSLRSKEFQFLSRLVSRLPVRRVIPHTDPAGLRRLCEAILEDHAGLLDRSGVARERVH